METGQNAGDIVSIEVGGYSRTLRWMAERKFPASDRIIDNRPAEITMLSLGHLDHVFYLPDEAEIDGAPALVSCFKTCDATLTINPDMIKARSNRWVQEGYGPDGIALKISFDEAYISRWPEIRDQALCFVAASVPAFEGRSDILNSNRKCSEVRKAIATTIQ